MSERNEHNDGNTQTAYFAGGCFWGLERYFQNVDGVTDTTVGYAQSKVESPSYEQVCAGVTDAAETAVLGPLCRFFGPQGGLLRCCCGLFGSQCFLVALFKQVFDVVHHVSHTLAENTEFVLAFLCL